MGHHKLSSPFPLVKPRFNSKDHWYSAIRFDISHHGPGGHVAGFSPQRSVFDGGPVHMRFSVGKVELARVSLLVLPFLPLIIIPPLLHTHLSPTLYNHNKRRCRLIQHFQKKKATRHHKPENQFLNTLCYYMLPLDVGKDRSNAVM